MKFILILIIIMLVLGVGELPGLGGGLGRGVNKIRRISSADNRRKMKSGFNIIKALIRAVVRLYYVMIKKK